jgi:hypothetical protein
MIRLSLPLPPLLATLSLVACGANPGAYPDTSYVAPLQRPADARVLAADMAKFVAINIPAMGGAFILDPTPSDQAGNPLTEAFAAALRFHGLAVVDAGRPEARSAHRIRYIVTPLDDGDLARLTIDNDLEGSRFFTRDTAGGLRAGGPFAMTRAEAMR